MGSLENFLAEAGPDQHVTFTNGGNFTEYDWDKVRHLLGHVQTGGKIMGGAYIRADLRNPERRAEARVERPLTEFEQRQLGSWGLKARYGELPLEV